ncbi:MAG TPA: DUF4296 domain-containing protein [Fulvivirga sp.]|nr:DUF4296 domain-containing protein [Fulvivirga sp.]
MRIIILLFACLMIVGCTRTKEIPNDIMKPNEMVPVLLDIYLAESQITELRLNRDTTASIFQTYEGLIYDSLNVDREKYKKSLTYYYDHTDQLEIIYEAILDTLTKRDSRLRSMQSKADSLVRKKAENK